MARSKSKFEVKVRPHKVIPYKRIGEISALYNIMDKFLGI